MKKLYATVLLGTALVLAACSSEPEYTEMDAGDTQAEVQADGMISDVLAADDRFSTLVQAVNEAGVGDRLSGPGLTTLFAPTDEAFSKLPEGALTELMKPENRDQLAAILRYHMVDGRTMKAGLNEAINSADGSAEIETLEGTVLLASVDEDGNVLITDTAGNKAMLTQTDVAAGNGVVQIVDTVLMPG